MRKISVISLPNLHIVKQTRNISPPNLLSWLREDWESGRRMSRAVLATPIDPSSPTRLSISGGLEKFNLEVQMQWL